MCAGVRRAVVLLYTSVIVCMHVLTSYMLISIFLMLVGGSGPIIDDVPTIYTISAERMTHVFDMTILFCTS